MKSFSQVWYLPLLLVLFSSCQQQEFSSLHETIYIRNEGADMPAYIRGNPRDKVFILVLHGAGSFGLAFREGIFPAELERDYAVAYWDQRGQSMSQGHYDKEEELVAQMARDVYALAQALKHRYGQEIRLFLFGHSWGGALGTTVLVNEAFQNQFVGWIDLDGIHDFPQAETARKTLLLETAAEQIALGNSVDAWTSILEEVAVLDSSSEDYFESILYIAQDGLSALQTDGLLLPEVLGSDLFIQTIVVNNPIHWTVSDWFNRPFEVAKEADYSLTDQLHSIQIPCLLLWGKYDFSVPPALGDSAYAKIGTTEKKLVIFEKSAHNPLLSEPVLVLAEIQSFIEQYK